MTTILNRSHYEEFLVQVYFPSGSNHLDRCILRAYLDFNRTLHGFSRIPLADQIRKEASEVLRTALCKVSNKHTNTVIDQEFFDQWHQSTCTAIADVFDQNKYNKIYVGQTQKWINMTFKYIYTMGENRIPGYSGLYAFCHVPLDSIILKSLSQIPDFPEPITSWSRIREYAMYMQIQNWIRLNSKMTPLDLEFMLWSGENVREIIKR